MIPWWWAACATPEPAPRPDPSPTSETAAPTGDTGTEALPGVLSASCATSAAHPLRVECQATLSSVRAATLALTAPTASPRAFTSEADAIEHELLGWGLEADTTYTWAIGEVSGTVTTGSLPRAFDAADIRVTGAAWGFDAVLVPLSCDVQRYWTMIEPDGDIVWYLANDVWNSNLRGYEWSQASRSVLSAHDRTLVEQHVSGQELLRLEQGMHFDHDLHHDIARWGDLTYTLYERRVGTVDVDGVYVFDGTTLIGDFRLDDWFTVSGPGGLFNDWSHANGLKVTDAGELVMSLYEFDTVVGIDGDPGSPTFLDKTWHAVGSPAGLPDADYAPLDGPLEGFSGQHNASRHGDALWLFDNDGAGSGSRAARFLLDAGAGTVALDAAWDLGLACPIQGGAVPLDGGGVLATCTSTADVMAFQEGATTPAWTLQASCSGGSFSLPPNRAIPVFIR